MLRKFRTNDEGAQDGGENRVAGIDGVVDIADQMGRQN
jgi:hypothetical protein